MFVRSFIWVLIALALFTYLNARQPVTRSEEKSSADGSKQLHAHAL